jgi:hypothetical protein
VTARSYPRGRTDDYCGYCGLEFKRRGSDPEGVCNACLNDPDPAVRQAILEAIDYAEADEANDRDLEERARRGK